MTLCKKGMLKVTMIIIMFSFLFFPDLNNIYASWLDNLIVSTPPATQETDREKRSMAGEEYEYVYYSSSLDRTEIVDYYRKKLKQTGWKERDLKAGLKKIPNFTPDQSMLTVLENNLLFEKDGRVFSINFLPVGIQKDKKTNYLVSWTLESKNKEDDEWLGEEDSTGELLTQPKKQVAPVYPGAKLISLDEGRDHSTLSYVSHDDLEQVLWFYRNNMVNYGWSLIEDMPVQSQEMNQEAMQQSCPSCYQNNIELPKGMQLRFAALKFKNNSEDICDVQASTLFIDSKQSLPGRNKTNIIINYYESSQ
ncbi:MAG: hypothetical protein ABIG46_00730 [Candidatus Omnitrophota bacterium]|nr:hypothetical protein [Candidatus Omnitrophota bacterium]